MKSVWTSGGVTKTHTTSRNTGESDAAWTHRQCAEVLARWQNGEAPDPGTTITTTWSTGGAAATKDVDDGLRAWIDEHHADCLLEQVQYPLP